MMESNLAEPPARPGADETSARTRPLGQLLVAMGAIDQRQLAKVLEIQRAQPAGSRKPLGRICVEQGFLSRERLDLILDRWSKRLRLGELLVNRGHVTPEQLEGALERQRQSDKRLGELLMEMGVIDEQILTETLAEQYDLPYVPLRDLQLTPNLGRYVNPQYASRHGVVPIGRIGRRLTVAIQDPTNGTLIGDLEHSTGLQIQAVMATPSEIDAIWRRLYEFGQGQRGGSPADERPDVEVGPTADLLLRQLITRAASIGATELILEPKGEDATVSVRVEGAAQSLPGTESLGRQVAILTRTLLISARLDPNDDWRPQVGYVRLETDEGDFSRSVQLEVRTHPGAHGGQVSAHIAGGRNEDLPFGLIDLRGGVHLRFTSLMKQAQGVVLIVGPTGSGKRSVLRGALGPLLQANRRVCTAEEPILRDYDGVEQISVEPDGDASYGCLFERFLSNDPDAILLERIADRDVAEQVFSVGRDGPLVLSTLRASNATSAVARLLGLGVAPEALASSLSGVLALRLLRRNCPSCEESYEPRRPVLDEWFLGEAPFTRWRRGSGCPDCRETGFAGTLTLTELWVPTADQLNIIGSEFKEDQFRELILLTMRCLGQDALQQAIEGRTTLEDSLKLVPYQDVIYTRLHGLAMEKSETVPFRCP